jgi:hypothetical protein
LRQICFWFDHYANFKVGRWIFFWFSHCKNPKIVIASNPLLIRSLCKFWSRWLYARSSFGLVISKTPKLITSNPLLIQLLCISQIWWLRWILFWFGHCTYSKIDNYVKYTFSAVFANIKRSNKLTTINFLQQFIIIFYSHFSLQKHFP